jgi:cytoskeletal protein RodZ
VKLSWLWLLPVAAYAQLSPNSVTATASRNPILPSDQMVFNVSIGASADTAFADVLAAAAGAGLTAADFRGVNYGSGAPSASWLFELRAPLNDTRPTVGLLTALQTSFAKEKKFTLSFQVGGSTLSAEAQAAQKCPLADLIADARTKAANLASAGGATVGAIQSLTSSTAGCAVTARFALGGGSPSGADSITITATTPPSTSAPNRLAVTLTVSADAGTSMDAILAAAAGTGVSAGDLLGVNQPFSGRVCVGTGSITTPCNPIEWTFRFSAPLAKWKDTIAALAAARSAKHPGITVDYGVSADAPAPPECATPTLLSRAQRRAQDLAAAAGVGVGALVAVSDASPQPDAVVMATRAGSFAPLPIASQQTGLVGYAGFVFDPITTFVPNPGPGCAVVAQYAMAH